MSETSFLEELKQKDPKQCASSSCKKYTFSIYCSSHEPVYHLYWPFNSREEWFDNLKRLHMVETNLPSETDEQKVNRYKFASIIHSQAMQNSRFLDLGMQEVLQYNFWMLVYRATLEFTTIPPTVVDVLMKGRWLATCDPFVKHFIDIFNLVDLAVCENKRAVYLSMLSHSDTLGKVGHAGLESAIRHRYDDIVLTVFEYERDWCFRGIPADATVFAYAVKHGRNQLVKRLYTFVADQPENKYRCRIELLRKIEEWAEASNNQTVVDYCQKKQLSLSQR